MKVPRLITQRGTQRRKPDLVRLEEKRRKQPITAASTLCDETLNLLRLRVESSARFRRALSRLPQIMRALSTLLNAQSNIAPDKSNESRATFLSGLMPSYETMCLRLNWPERSARQRRQGTCATVVSS